MHATRPRSSILHLFDPLALPAPSRDAPSPDSDKENSCPTLAEAFFGRILKQPSPVVLKRRLIDVGDVTVDDPSMLAMLTDEEQLNESMCDDDNDTLTLPRLPAATPARFLVTQVECRTPTSSGPRTPLGELALDRDITPIVRTKMYKRQAPVPSSSCAFVIPTAPDNSNISSVVNTVNASGAPFAFPGPIKPSLNYHDLIQDHQRNSNNTETPRITISSADVFSDSLSTLDPPTPTGSLLTDVSRPFASTPLSHACETSSLHLSPGLRRDPPKTSSGDPNRRSVDLYSSFQLQLQSEEASFDLLNDKISFFASSNGMESFLNAMEEDDNFDMTIKEKKLQQAVEKIQQKETPLKGTKLSAEDVIPHLKKPVFGENINTPPVIATISVEEAKPKTSQGPSPGGGLNSELPVSSTFLFGQGIQPAKLATREELTPDSATNTSVFVPPPNQRVVTQVGVHTPAPVVREAAPPPIHALRIVKRAKRPGHEKTNSSSSASSTEAASMPREPMETLPAPTPSSTEPAPAPPNARPKSTLAVGAERVTYGRVVAPTSTSALPSLSSGTGTGPRRVPIIDSQASSRTGFGNQRALSPTNMTGPRRVVVAPSVRATPTTAPGKVPAVSGLKAPAKYGAGSTAASALPRHVSRLPAPSGSGFARLRPAAGTMSSIGNGARSQRNAERALPARRMAYGGQ